MRTHQPSELIDDFNVSLQLLKEGNARFQSGNLINKDSYKADCDVLATGQKPFAIVLCCSDSRVAPEIFFDQKLGDIFVVRNAGNIADKTALGSIEYAAEHLKAPLVVVIGHSLCGAVTAACQGGQMPPNIAYIIQKITPSCKPGGTVDEAIRANVATMVAQVKGDEIIEHMHAEVVGAYYDVHSGAVSWL